MINRNRYMALALCLTLALALGACAKHATPHPNQLDAFDGQTYDSLVAAQATLDEAKAQFSAGKLPPTAKPVINSAGAAYEQARTAWQLRRDIMLGVKSGDAESTRLLLLNDMNQLAQAIVSLQKLIGGK
jgi:opacity protein-like surface antigen